MRLKLFIRLKCAKKFKMLVPYGATESKCPALLYVSFSLIPH